MNDLLLLESIQKCDFKCVFHIQSSVLRIFAFCIYDRSNLRVFCIVVVDSVLNQT